MTTTTLYVTASGDDAEEEFGQVNLAGDFPSVTENFLSGLIFPAVPIPPGATVATALLLIVPYSVDSDTPNLTIRGEIDPAAWSEAVEYDLTDRAKTSEGVIWNEAAVYAGAGVYATSPNLAAVIQEIIDYGGWLENGDIGLYLIDRGLGGVLTFYAYDFGPNTYPPALFLEWTVPVITGELDYGWPGDYWPDEYWAEYWPDYGTATPGTSMGPIAFMHLQRMHRRSSL